MIRILFFINFIIINKFNMLFVKIKIFIHLDICIKRISKDTKRSGRYVNKVNFMIFRGPFMFEASVFFVLSISIIINIGLRIDTKFDGIDVVISSGKKHIRAKMITHNNVGLEKAWKVNKRKESFVVLKKRLFATIESYHFHVKIIVK